MKKQIISISLVLLLLCFLPAVALAESTFAQAEELIQQKITCTDLSQEQLESIGDYYMEQMHPGEAHKIMDNMMGGEGSVSLKQVHINMARRLYCNDSIYIGYGMMGTGGMMGLMNGGMTNMMYGTGYGMMGTGGWFWMSFLWLFWIALAAFIFGIIFWWTYKLLQGESYKKNRGKK